MNKDQKKRVDVYKKHYSMIPLQIRQNGFQWEVYYVIRYMDAKRPLYMRIAVCKSKQLAAVKISDIEDYTAGDAKILKSIDLPQVSNTVPTLYGSLLSNEMNTRQDGHGQAYHKCIDGKTTKGTVADCLFAMHDDGADL